MLSVFFFNDTATTEIYTLSLHDALPIYQLLASLLQDLHAHHPVHLRSFLTLVCREPPRSALTFVDRKSTRLNSSHANISYAVFCLKKKIHRLERSLTARITATLHGGRIT